MHLVCRVLSACLFFMVAGNTVAQSKDPCSDHDSRRAWESRTDPIYADAMELAGTLENYGFVVECVRSSKLAGLFEGQKGAAWYKAKQGVFEVLFLPELLNWDGLEVVDEPTTGGRHNYTFRGTPRTVTRMEGAKHITFIRHKNLMFEVFDDEELANRLGRAFPSK